MKLLLYVDNTFCEIEDDDLTHKLIDLIVEGDALVCRYSPKKGGYETFIANDERWEELSEYSDDEDDEDKERARITERLQRM